MKHYLIDSENVGDFWIPLLDLPAQETELVVFYTRNSPHMSYESLIKLKESDRKVTFVKCYEGTNALDFQLCSELGFRIAQSRDDDFIIVTNDTGYDAAVKYWRHKEYSVKRIAGKDSRTGSRRRGNLGRYDVAAEVSAALDVQIDDDLENTSRQDQAGEEEKAFSESALFDESVKDADAAAEYETEEDEAVQVSPEAEEAVEDEDLQAGEPASEWPEAEAGNEAADALSEEPSEGESDGKESLSGDTEEDSEEESEAPKAPEALIEELPEEPKEAEAAGEGPIDPEEITAIVSCIAPDNLAELHNQLIQFYGENGKEIYQQIKNGQLDIDRQDWSKQEKFLYYTALIFRHSGEEIEDLSEEELREFAQFLLSSENKRKNLNSLRYALIKHYGKEKGRKYYFLVKPYVKAFNQM